MQAINWELPIPDLHARALELSRLQFDGSVLSLDFNSEELERAWTLRFREVQGFRTTADECSGALAKMLPSQGAFFEIVDSTWLKELGKGTIGFLDKSRHFVACFYEEVVEVVAWDYELAEVAAQAEAVV